MALGITFSGDLPLGDVISYARRAEELGFTSIWVAEHQGLRDSITSASVIALSTKNCSVGLGVVSPYTRNPLLMAMTLASLDELSGGRTILGLGAAKRFWRTLGVRDPRPLATMKAYVKALRNLLKGERVDLEAPFQLQGACLSFEPPRQSPPIYIGAMHEGMFRLAREVGDGVLLSNGAAVEHARYAAKLLGSEGGGKVMACYIMAWSEEEEPLARRRAKRRLATFLANEGWEILLGPQAAEEPQVMKICRAAREGRIEEAAELVDDELLARVSIVGRRGHIPERLMEYREAGVQLPILRPMGDALGPFLEAFALAARAEGG